jgi:TolB-like protein/DNA-binding winged helix-turn-helix (wHTH) protein/Flp pilus assembly protein TadD
MGESTHSPRMVRFGVFEVDLRAGELRKQGSKIKLQEQPFQILSLLLEHPGEVVTREEIQKKLWPVDTFVDFEHSLNAAVKRLREALGDSAETPRFVETIPRRGYRFIYPVERPGRASRIRQLRIVALAVVALLAVLIGLNVAGLRERLLGKAGRGQITSIAVLPLENLSGDPEQDYFSDGMTQQLITELGRLNGLERVISWQSVKQLKNTEDSLLEIAQRLNVQSVLVGTAFFAGETVRVNLELYDASERRLWGDSYERQSSDILVLQSEVTRTVANQIQVVVTPVEENRLVAARSTNPEAYRLYLLGRFYWNKRKVEAGGKAIEYFEQAIAIDPDYALAYAGLADAQLILLGKENETKGRAAAKRAVEINPLLGEAHASLGYDATYVRWDWADAEQHFRRAIELSPNYAFAYLWYGSHLSRLGRFDEALNKTQRALELDPLSIVINRAMGARYYEARDYEEAIKSLKKTIEMDPTHDWPHLFLGLSYLQMERFQEAIEELQKADALDTGPDDWSIALAAEARAHAAIGKIDEARKLVEKIIKIGEQQQKKLGGYSPSYDLAQSYVALGQLDRAFEWLERAYRERDWRMISIGIDPAMDPLRADPRFQSLLRRMNFPE